MIVMELRVTELSSVIEHLLSMLSIYKALCSITSTGKSDVGREW